jgi:hypothetical protein
MAYFYVETEKEIEVVVETDENVVEFVVYIDGVRYAIATLSEDGFVGLNGCEIEEAGFSY